LLSALEIFNTGNYAKVTPCVRYESRTLAAGPIATLARDRYFDYMEQQ
jgi:branched-chain amino acid aminotransferase